MNCIVCKAELKKVHPDDISCVNAVTFRGYGNYGSAFDESPKFAIFICDGCLHDAIQEEIVLEERTTKRIETHYHVAVNESEIPL